MSLDLFPFPILYDKHFYILISSVTRLGDFLLFGQPFEAGGSNYFTQIAHIVRQFL